MSFFGSRFDIQARYLQSPRYAEKFDPSVSCSAYSNLFECTPVVAEGIRNDPETYTEVILGYAFSCWA
jgi:hypothetical protein